MTTVAVPLVAFALDLLLGDPAWLPHPVVFIGKAIAFLEKTLRRVFPKSPRGELAAGAALVILVCAAAALPTIALLRFLARATPWLSFAAECWLGYQLLATKCLADAARNVLDPLLRGDLPAARQAVGMIVGRDPVALDETGVIRATVETVAENASDGVVAPLVYMAVGGVPLAMLYKAINTMDSMVGYKNDKYLYFGRAAARLDDVANFIPARLTALLMIPAALLCRYDWRNARRILRRDRRNHSSPNSAYPEAACAGALGVALGGPSTYFGRIVDKPFIGDAARAVEPEDIRRANRLLYATALLALALCAAIACACDVHPEWEPLWN